MSAGSDAPNFESGFDGLLAEPARNARAGDDEGLHAGVLRARLDRGVHDLGRDLVLRRPRTHGSEARAHAGVVRPRRGAKRGRSRRRVGAFRASRTSPA